MMNTDKKIEKKGGSILRGYLEEILAGLAKSRPIFHSEADFQHELALHLHSAGWPCRLEVPLTVLLKESQVKAEVDILTYSPIDDTPVAIELKYVSAKLTVNHEGESFNLANNWGTNLARFDCLADWERVAAIVAAGHAAQGFTVFLTNAKDAWVKDVSQTDILAQNMSIHEGRELTDGESLSWPENINHDSVGKKRLPPYAPINCPVSASCDWNDYSLLEAARNARFRYLLLEG